jgi:hypothetical protein
MLGEGNAQFMVEDPLVAFLDEALNDLWPDPFLTTNKLLQEVLQPYKSRKDAHPKALAQAMATLGWKSKDCTSGKDKGRKGYERPAPPPPEEEEAT